MTNFITLNVRGIVSKTRVDRVGPVLTKADVAFLQETFVSTKEKGENFRDFWHGEVFWSFGTKKSAGVAIAVKSSANFVIKEVRRDGEGRVISLLAVAAGVRYSLICVYAPVDPRMRKVLLSDLARFVYPGSYVIIGGDFNCVLKDSDTSCTSGANRTGQKELSGFLRDNDLQDVWSVFHREVPAFTWVGPYGVSRLDRFYLASSLCDALCSVYQRPSGCSDHDGVGFEIKLAGMREKIRPMWKFNNSILEDQECVFQLREWLTKEIKCGVSWEKWVSFKAKIKSRVKKLCIDRARNARRRKILATERIVKLKQDLASGKEVEETLARCEGELRECVSKEAAGVQIRSKARWVEQGEKPTRYSYSLCRSHFSKNEIVSLKNRDGLPVDDQKGLLEIIEDFYTNLFRREEVDTDAQDVLLSNLENALDEEGREICAGEICEEEIKAAMAGMARDKTPGEDGLSLEFYLCFSDLLCPMLKAFANECFDRGGFPRVYVRSVVRLAFKKNDKTDLKKL